MKKKLTIAQVTDCHLFADKSQLHCGANVYNNLYCVLKHIQVFDKPDCIVFTGDLTQDHTEESYQQFRDVFSLLAISIPVYYLAGNHDEQQLLNTYLVNDPFSSGKVIENDYWQIMLLDTKSETPAGIVTNNTLNELNQSIKAEKQQLIMMHHHPINVGYFIDKHGLNNKETLWEYIKTKPSIKAFACGHVHQAIDFLPSESGYALPLYTCPATSIQFTTDAQTSECNGQGPGYRLFELYDDGTYRTHVHFMSEFTL